jgi:ElaB/YqjD/DUF883 family membrane-anchored ribosome-binding protein
MRQQEINRGRSSNGNSKKEDLKAEIEHTRSRIGGELGAITHKFSSEHIKSEAKSRVRRAGRRAKHAGASLPQTARNNPVPLMVIGLGVGWLAVEAWRRAGAVPEEYELELDVEPSEYEGSYVAVTEAPPTEAGERPGIKERASEAMQRAGEVKTEALERSRHGVQRIGQTARSGAHQVRSRFGDMLEDNPLAVGAVAVGVGAAVGLLLPSSSAEDRWFGEQRDRMLERARDKASEVGDAARGALEAGRDTAEEEARQRGLLPAQAAAEASEVAKKTGAEARAAFERNLDPSRRS